MLKYLVCYITLNLNDLNYRKINISLNFNKDNQDSKIIQVSIIFDIFEVPMNKL